MKRRRRVSVPRHVRRLLQAIGQMAERRGVNAYAVGGCIRDWLLGVVRTTDVDIVVEGDGIAFAQAVTDALGGTLVTHQQFGTATVSIHARRLDIASCRKETYRQPAAYPKISAGRLADDLRRRDFTINAMALAITPDRFGQLIDPFGGVADLRRKALRVLHRRSFMDDPSRILRGVRFAQRFHLHWDRKTEQAAREAIRAGALGWLNVGRLRKELDRMLGEDNPRDCLERLAALLQRPASTWRGSSPAARS